MKAIILAGGHATRLWPVTKNRAKPLLPLGERPVIDHVIEGLEAEEIIISTNEKYRDDFEDYIKYTGRKDISLHVEDQRSEDEKPGTIGALLEIIDDKGIDDDLLIIGGDNYYSFDTDEFLEFAAEKEGPVNAVYELESMSQASQFGIVETKGDKITGFEEKPDDPSSRLASTAFYYFPRSSLDLFDRYVDHFSKIDVPEEEYLDSPGQLLEWGHKQRDIYAFSFKGEWHDIGTPKGYIEAMKSVMEGNLIDGETVKSEIGDNVVVLEGSTVRNSKLENAVIFQNVEVVDCEIRNSIVDRDCEIRDADLNDAVIGEHTTM